MGREVNLIEAYRVTPMVSASVIVGERLLKRRPEVAQSFTRAVHRASSYIVENRGQVLPLIKPHVPTLTDSNININEKVLFASIDLWMDADIDRYGLGYTTVDDWRQAIDTLLELGMIVNPMDPEDCFTNSLLD
jgi:ABC-type nitrate/sulfonate/bicarbonate transport system substrate-binding protein